MSFKKYIPGIILFFSILSLYCNCLQAQTENIISLDEKDSLKLKGSELFNKFQFLSQPNIRTNLNYNSFLNGFEKRNHILFLNPTNSIKNFTFNQQKTELELSGLGNSQCYNNELLWDIGKKFTLGLEAGLAIQNTIINPLVPNYQFSFGFTINYAINNRLNAYLFGHYFSSPLNKPDDYFDPFMYNNALFLQSGTGTGLKSNIKNTFIDFQIMSGYDHQLKIMNNMNSKLQIKF